MTDSPDLAEWLVELLAADESMDFKAGDDDDDDDDDDEIDGSDDLTDEESGAALTESKSSSRIIWYFPSEEIREEYLATISSRSEEEVRAVISHMLIPSGAFGIDHLNFMSYVGFHNKPDVTPEELENLRKWSDTPHMTRVLNYYSGKSKEFPWQGIKWVLHLLPSSPRMALNALEAYVEAYGLNFSDNMISALSDVEAVIRARYIGIPGSAPDRMALLRELGSREFEHLVEHLYHRMGYATELTPASKDGGKDIIATRSTAGMNEQILIECKKRHDSKIRVEVVDRLAGIVSRSLVNKGVVVTTTDFTRGARRIESTDRRIELLNGSDLVQLLNEYLGWAWPAQLEYLIRPLKRYQD